MLATSLCFLLKLTLFYLFIFCPFQMLAEIGVSFSHGVPVQINTCSPKVFKRIRCYVQYAYMGIFNIIIFFPRIVADLNFTALYSVLGQIVTNESSVLPFKCWSTTKESLIVLEDYLNMHSNCITLSLWKIKWVLKMHLLQ